MECLDPRLILDAPLALASDGLLLAGPAGIEREEPALFAGASPRPAAESAAQAPSTAPALPPLDDPLSPVGDPPAGRRAVSSAECETCITYNVSVVAIRATDEADPGTTGLFRFSATASCTSGAPSSITVSYNRSGSTASATSNPADYNGEITSDSVVIPLVNGSGSKDKTYNVVDDAIDEPVEYVKVTIPPTSTIFPVHPYGSAMSHIYDNDIEWRAADAIQGIVTTTAGDDPAVSINAYLGLSVAATDRDQYKEDGVWVDYGDDVTSGETVSDYHIKWTASEGQLFQNGVAVSVAYGIGVTWVAPDYAEGQNDRSVTITATVDDFNRGTDVDGFDDEPLELTQNIDVWQVSLKHHHNGMISNNYDAREPGVENGDGQLGWIEPMKPIAATYYCGSTEVRGTLGDKAAVSGYQWGQHLKGFHSHQEAGIWIMDQGFITWTIEITPRGWLPVG